MLKQSIGYFEIPMTEIWVDVFHRLLTIGECHTFNVVGFGPTTMTTVFSDWRGGTECFFEAETDDGRAFFGRFDMGTGQGKVEWVPPVPQPQPMARKPEVVHQLSPELSALLASVAN